MIGVNSQIATGGTSQGNVGIGFAVPAEHGRATSSRGCSAARRSGAPYLGVSTAAGSGGAVVREATAGGPAARAGIRAGDVIVARRRASGCASPTTSPRRSRTARRATRVEVELRRDGDARTVTVELAARPEQAP